MKKDATVQSVQTCKLDTVIFIQFKTASTFAHVLGDDVDGFFRHHRVELYQFVMSELLHDLSLLEEGLG